MQLYKDPGTMILSDSGGVISILGGQAQLGLLRISITFTKSALTLIIPSIDLFTKSH